MNKYSPLTFFGLVMIPIIFGVVHAQENTNSTNSNDPFDLMLNQAREQQRQRILQDFTKNQKENEAQNSAMTNKPASSVTQNQTDQANGKTRPNDASNPVPPEQTSPTAGIPAPSADPTNTQQPSAATNIYVPPPPPAGVNPTPPPASTPPPAQPSQPPANTNPPANRNIYG